MSFCLRALDLAVEMPDQTPRHRGRKPLVAIPVAVQGEVETQGHAERRDVANVTHQPERVPMRTSCQRKNELIEEGIEKHVSQLKDDQWGGLDVLHDLHVDLEGNRQDCDHDLLPDGYCLGLWAAEILRSIMVNTRARLAREAFTYLDLLLYRRLRSLHQGNL